MTKFSPDRIIKLNLEENLEDLTFDEQKRIKLSQEISHLERDMQMKETWSLILGIYLVIFTLLMFLTLWINSDKLELEPTTLNFIITVGFAKVIGVVWAIVSHLFPSKK